MRQAKGRGEGDAAVGRIAEGRDDCAGVTSAGLLLTTPSGYRGALFTLSIEAGKQAGRQSKQAATVTVMTGGRTTTTTTGLRGWLQGKTYSERSAARS